MSNIIQDTIRKYNPLKTVKGELLVHDKRIPVSVTRWGRGQLVLKPDMNPIFEDGEAPIPGVPQERSSAPAPASETKDSAKPIDSGAPSETSDSTDTGENNNQEVDNPEECD